MRHINGRHADRRIFTEREMEFDGEDAADYAKANARLMNAVADVLQRSYPGNPWFVRGDVRNGIFYIGLGGFTHWGHLIKIESIKADPQMKCVVKAAGELLERLRMPRAGFSMSDWRAALARNPIWRQRRGLIPT